MIDFFVSDIKFTVSLILTVVSLILAFVFYYRSLNWKTPCYSKTNRLLVDSDLLSLNPIKVLFKDEPIQTLSISHIAFWNDGKATINKDDIVRSDKLRIVARNSVKILAIEIAQINRPANKVKVIQDKENCEFFIDFDFLDFKNGFVVKIYHTGESVDDIDIEGSIKGVNSIIDIFKNEQSIGRILEKFHTRFMDKIFRITPKWFWKVDEYAESRGLIPYMLVRLPLTIIAAPFVIVYMAVGGTLVLITMVLFIINSGRYSVPKEFYSIMRYG